MSLVVVHNGVLNLRLSGSFDAKCTFKLSRFSFDTCYADGALFSHCYCYLPQCVLDEKKCKVVKCLKEKTFQPNLWPSRS